ncbi:Heat shock factor protein hsf24 [Sarracenia purpurea var. burkii]
MARRSVPAPFLTKTYELVEDASSDEVISWNESGETFVVWQMADFARDLLPKYFKHNNFSSFVRQLNTYGFRKIVPDKWEFANENFKRGKKELLTQIRRRKTVTSTPASRKSAAVGGASSPSNSGDDLGSTSTSSPDSKNAGSVDVPARAQFADLSDENKKLKRDNELLSSELAQAKKQCDDLVAFLTDYVKVAPDRIDRIMRQRSSGFSGDGFDGEIGSTLNEECDNDNGDAAASGSGSSAAAAAPDDNNKGGKTGDGLKLFGVWVKGNEKKRGRHDKLGIGGGHRKEIKTVEFDAPWMTSKVCN